MLSSEISLLLEERNCFPREEILYFSRSPLSQGLHIQGKQILVSWRDLPLKREAEILLYVLFLSVSIHLTGNEYNSKVGNSSKLFLVPFWKGAYSKMEEFAPKGNKFFPFRVDPFRKGIDVQESKQEVT